MNQLISQTSQSTYWWLTKLRVTNARVVRDTSKFFASRTCFSLNFRCSKVERTEELSVRREVLSGPRQLVGEPALLGLAKKQKRIEIKEHREVNSSFCAIDIRMFESSGKAKSPKTPTVNARSFNKTYEVVA